MIKNTIFSIKKQIHFIKKNKTLKVKTKVINRKKNTIYVKLYEIKYELLPKRKASIEVSMLIFRKIYGFLINFLL